MIFEQLSAAPSMHGKKLNIASTYKEICRHAWEEAKIYSRAAFKFGIDLVIPLEIVKMYNPIAILYDFAPMMPFRFSASSILLMSLAGFAESRRGRRHRQIE